MTDRDKHRMNLLKQVIEDAEMDAQNTIQLIDDHDTGMKVKSVLLKLQGCRVILTEDK